MNHSNIKIAARQSSRRSAFRRLESILVVHAEESGMRTGPRPFGQAREMRLQP